MPAETIANLLMGTGLAVSAIWALLKLLFAWRRDTRERLARGDQQEREEIKADIRKLTFDLAEAREQIASLEAQARLQPNWDARIRDLAAQIDARLLELSRQVQLAWQEAAHNWSCPRAMEEEMGRAKRGS